MIPDLTIHQALLLSDSRGVKVVAQSEGFDQPEAERIAVLFGRRPPGASCPLAHFACPFGNNRVAVVQVADRPGGSDAPLAFRFLVVHRGLYAHLGDPFAIADRYPPVWDAHGTLPSLQWPPEPLPKRTVAQIDAILRDGDGPLLLGGTQLLVDGSQLILQRSEPAEKLIRDLWQLLPDRSRADLWPASMAFSLDLGFHAAALPELPTVDPHRYHTEEQARDYPQGKYEFSLQSAAEHGDQLELDRLFARRTSNETLRLGLYILGGVLVLTLVAKLLL